MPLHSGPAWSPVPAMATFTFLTAGESHGPQLTIIVTGMPAGVRLDRARINNDLRRRQHGYGRGGRMKIETDEAEITAGVRGGETLGSPIAMTIRNPISRTGAGRWIRGSSTMRRRTSGACMRRGRAMSISRAG
jgi:chorismate synthase